MRETLGATGAAARVGWGGGAAGMGATGGGGGGGGPAGPAGPQAERSAAWLSEGGELKAPPQREALVMEGVADTRIYEQEMARLRAELEFSHDQGHRLQKELKLYQLKYPHAAARIGQAEVDAEEDLPPWISSQEIMAPLLAAYDSRIHDLECTVGEQRSQLATVSQRTEQLVEENERLRESQISDIDSLVQQTEASGGLGGIGAREMVDELNQRLEMLMQENTLMADQAQALGREVDNNHQDLQERDAQIASLSGSLQEAGAALRSLEEQVPQLEAEKRAAEAELLRTVNAMAEVESRLVSTRTELSRTTEDRSSLQQRLAEAKAAAGQAQRQMDAEVEGISERVQKSAARVSELQGMLANKSLEAETYGEQARRLSKELEVTRSDAEGMLQVMGGMERQLGEYSAREEATLQLTRESKQKVEDALLARDQARALEIQSRRELGRVLEARKHDNEERLRETDEAVSALQAKMNAAVDSREAQIKEVVADNARLRGEFDRAMREKASLETVSSKLQRSLEEEQASLKAQLDTQQKRLLSTEAERAEDHRAHTEQQEEAAAALSELTGKYTQGQTKVSALENMLKARESEVEAVRAALRGASDRAEAKEREVFKANMALEQLRSEVSSGMEDLALSKDAELENLRLQMTALETKAREAERRQQEAESSRHKATVTAKASLQRDLAEAQRSLKDEAELAQRYKARNVDLQNRLATLAGEKNQLACMAAARGEDAGQVAGRLEASQRQVEEMRRQLTETLRMQEQRVRDEAQSRAEVKRLQLDLARVQREKERERSFSRGVGGGGGSGGILLSARSVSASARKYATPTRTSLGDV